jgi:hypothetical protein
LRAVIEGVEVKKKVAVSESEEAVQNPSQKEV